MASRLSLTPFPYIGSFQRGQIIRTGDPLAAVWRRIERVGTIDNLSRVADQRSQDPSIAKVASLRIRQAVELRRASRDTSSLTRPLMLYYAALNLIRGVMLTYTGDIGNPSHGLKYAPGPSLLECSAKPTRSGTFKAFALTIGVEPDDVTNKTYKLRDLFALVPELRSDFALLNAGASAIAYVGVKAYIDGDVLLRYYVEGVTDEEFRNTWPQKLSWLDGVCEPGAEAFTLRVKDPPKGEEAVAEFCAKYLMHNLMWRDDALWFDHVTTSGIVMLPRLPAYLGALFILSNVSRYEPEFLDTVTREPTDVGYVLNAFLDCAERFLPQLVLELLQGPTYFT